MRKSSASDIAETALRQPRQKWDTLTERQSWKNSNLLHDWTSTFTKNRLVTTLLRRIPQVPFVLSFLNFAYPSDKIRTLSPKNRQTALETGRRLPDVIYGQPPCLLWKNSVELHFQDGGEGSLVSGCAYMKIPAIHFPWLTSLWSSSWRVTPILSIM